MAESSTVARWELALRIKKRRDELGLKADQIARELGFTRNFFSAVENERAMLATEKLELLMEMLRLNNVERAEFRELDRIARTRGWWDSHEDVLGEQGLRYLGLEFGALSICTFDALVIPGLLQTQEYHRSLIDRDPYFGRVQIDALADIRKRRQQEVFEAGTAVTAMISEGALLQIWSDEDMRRNQLTHLLDLIDRYQSLNIRILPLNRRPGVVVVAATLVIFGFASEKLPDLIYQEALRPLPALSQKDEQFRRIQIAWDESLSLSLSREESVHKLARLL